MISCLKRKRRLWREINTFPSVFFSSLDASVLSFNVKWMNLIRRKRTFKCLFPHRHNFYEQINRQCVIGETQFFQSRGENEGKIRGKLKNTGFMPFRFMIALFNPSFIISSQYFVICPWKRWRTISTTILILVNGSTCKYFPESVQRSSQKRCSKVRSEYRVTPLSV